MEKVTVGEIEGYPVLYLPEKDLVYCKNTAVPLSTLLSAVNSGMDRTEIPDKNLSIRVYSNTIELGCLTTTKENFKQIHRNIKKSKHYECK